MKQTFIKHAGHLLGMTVMKKNNNKNTQLLPWKAPSLPASLRSHCAHLQMSQFHSW